MYFLIIETADHLLKHLVGSKEYIKIDMAAAMEKRKEQVLLF